MNESTAGFSQTAGFATGEPRKAASGTVGGNGADVTGTVYEFRPSAAVPNFIAEEFNR